MTVHVNGCLTRTMNPGDIVHLGGIFLPIPYTGFQAVRAGLLTDTYLEVHDIHQLKKQYSEMEVTAEMRAAIERLHDDPTVYQKLAFSIAPEIYGHVDVKKALLLLLVGGVTKTTGDGMKIRGDLNICLMGDPGVAKSQLLKYISKVAPRGVYTTGKGSSGVGLTAAVMRDPVTDEMVLGMPLSLLCHDSIFDASLQRGAHLYWLTTAYAASTSLIRWMKLTERRSTKSWSSRLSPSPKRVSQQH
jgi:DNA replication licensing factor MCM7